MLYQDAVIDHTKTVISLTSKIYGSREGTPNQLKKRYHDEADTLKRNEGVRNTIAHGGSGGTARGLTEGQLWENSVAVGMLPRQFIEYHYDERGESVHSGDHLDEVIETGVQAFLDDVARLLHDFEQEISAPS